MKTIIEIRYFVKTDNNSCYEVEKCCKDTMDIFEVLSDIPNFVDNYILETEEVAVNKYGIGKIRLVVLDKNTLLLAEIPENTLPLIATISM